jgi:hypothetical protein
MGSMPLNAEIVPPRLSALSSATASAGRYPTLRKSANGCYGKRPVPIMDQPALASEKCRSFGVRHSGQSGDWDGICMRDFVVLVVQWASSG